MTVADDSGAIVVVGMTIGSFRNRKSCDYAGDVCRVNTDVLPLRPLLPADLSNYFSSLNRH